MKIIKIVIPAAIIIGIYIAAQYGIAFMDDSSFGRYVLSVMGPNQTTEQMEGYIFHEATKRGLIMREGAIQLSLGEPKQGATIGGVIQSYTTTGRATVSYQSTIFFFLKKSTTLTKTKSFPVKSDVINGRHQELQE